MGISVDIVLLVIYIELPSSIKVKNGGDYISCRGATRPRHPRQILGVRGLGGPGRGPRRKEEREKKRKR